MIKPKKQKLSIVLFIIIVLIAIAFVAFYILRARGENIEIPVSMPFLPKSTICIDSMLTEDVQNFLKEWAESNNLEINDNSNCTIKITRNEKEEGETYTILSEKIYLLVSNQFSDIYTINYENPNEFSEFITQHKYQTYALTWDTDTDKYVSSAFETGIGYEIANYSELAGNIEENSGILAIIPFDKANPHFRVISINNNSPYSKSFSTSTYPLVDRVLVNSKSKSLLNLLKKDFSDRFSYSNYSKDKLFDIILTGRSKIGKGNLGSVARQKNDYSYTVKGVANTLSLANISHISNATPFTSICNPDNSSNIYCTTPDAASLFDTAGIDVVGITSERNLDYGVNGFKSTLNILNQKSMTYIGGGQNADDANKVGIIEKKNTKVGFIGYNFVPMYYNVFAGASNLGTNQNSKSRMQNAISSSKAQTSLTVVQMEWGQEYSTDIVDYQVDYGHAAVDYGADIVFGTRPSVIQKYEYYNNGIIFYGLGNFINDELWSEDVREGIMLRCVMYDKRFVGFEIIPVRLTDNLQIEILQDTEKMSVLNKITNLSKI